jgi:hypothetical protein
MVLWTNPDVSNGDHSSPALSATDVYVSYVCGLEYALDRATGELRWFNDGPCSGGGGWTPVYHDGLVYARDFFFGNEIIDASSGTLVGTFQADPAPAFAGKTGVFLDGGTPSGGQGPSHAVGVHRRRRAGHCPDRGREHGLCWVIERDALRAGAGQGSGGLEYQRGRRDPRA